MTLAAGFRIPSPVDETRWSTFQNAGDAEGGLRPLAADGGDEPDAARTAGAPKRQDPRFHVFRHSGILVAQAETNEGDTATDAAPPRQIRLGRFRRPTLRINRAGAPPKVEPDKEPVKNQPPAKSLLVYPDKDDASFEADYLRVRLNDFCARNGALREYDYSIFLHDRGRRDPQRAEWVLRHLAARRQSSGISFDVGRDEWGISPDRFLELLSQGKFAESVALAEELRSIDSSRPEHLFVLAEANRLSGKTREAQAFYRKYLEQEPHSPLREEIEKLLEEPKAPPPPSPPRFRLGSRVRPQPPPPPPPDDAEKQKGHDPSLRWVVINTLDHARDYLQDPTATDVGKAFLHYAFADFSSGIFREDALTSALMLPEERGTYFYRRAVEEYCEDPTSAQTVLLFQASGREVPKHPPSIPKGMNTRRYVRKLKADAEAAKKSGNLVDAALFYCIAQNVDGVPNKGRDELVAKLKAERAAERAKPKPWELSLGTVEEKKPAPETGGGTKFSLPIENIVVYGDVARVNLGGQSIFSTDAYLPKPIIDVVIGAARKIATTLKAVVDQSLGNGEVVREFSEGYLNVVLHSTPMLNGAEVWFTFMTSGTRTPDDTDFDGRGVPKTLATQLMQSLPNQYSVGLTPDDIQKTFKGTGEIQISFRLPIPNVAIMKMAAPTGGKISIKKNPDGSLTVTTPDGGVIKMLPGSEMRIGGQTIRAPAK